MTTLLNTHIAGVTRQVLTPDYSSKRAVTIDRVQKIG